MIWDEVIPANNAGFNGSFVFDIDDDDDDTSEVAEVPIPLDMGPTPVQTPPHIGPVDLIADGNEGGHEEALQAHGQFGPEQFAPPPDTLPLVLIPEATVSTRDLADYARAMKEDRENWENYRRESEKLENGYQLEVGPTELEIINFWAIACPTLERVAFKQTKQRYTVWSKSPICGDWSADRLPADVNHSRWAYLRSCEWPGRVEN
ncbi:hypothetical protein DL93DRAFT_502733 [Clavulina sp. PMI_390]|nr:hypothetical protein DL93DRAFT_502733 [Clavulina sp. PMI_390]